MKLEDLRGMASDATNPADLIRQASAMASKSLAPEKPALTNGEAREHAKDVLVSAVAAVIAQVEALALVDADERLAGLTEFERGVIADLVDRARVTLSCDFDWQEDEGEVEEDGDGEH